MRKKNSRKEEGSRESVDSARGEGTGPPPWLSNSQWGMQAPRRRSASASAEEQASPKEKRWGRARPARKTFPTFNMASCICHNKQTVRETSRKGWTSTFWKHIGQPPAWILGQWLGDRTSCCWVISRCLLFFSSLAFRSPAKNRKELITCFSGAGRQGQARLLS